jgi:VWFA-related protein
MTLATAALAQEKLFESVEVHVVNVDVVVTDRAGHPVSGLTKDDFEIFEDGARQTITNFSEYRSENRPAQSTDEQRPAAEPPPRRFLLFIDNSGIDAAARTPVFDGLRRFVTSRLRGGDEAAVVVFDRSLRLVAPLTSDRVATLAAIDSVAAAPSPSPASNGFVRVQRECLHDYADAIAHRVPPNVASDLCMHEAQQQMTVDIVRNRRLADAMRMAVTTIGGLDGRKAMIVAGSGLPLRPGYELFTLAKQTFAGLIRGFPPIDDKRFERQTEEVEDVARHASSYDVALYFLNTSQAVESSGVQIGVAAPSTGGADFLRSGNTQDAYQLLADETGGLAPRQRNVDAALASIVETLDSYYSIGYKPAKTLGSEHRAIQVKSRNREYTVHARQTFTPKSASAQMGDRVVANIFAPQASAQWPIDVRTGAPKRDGRNYVVPLDISIPATLTMLPHDAKLIGGFALYVAVGSDLGAMSSTFREPHGLSIAPNEEAEFRARPIPYHTTLTLSPGRNFVSVGVLDLISNTAGFARIEVVVP